jgi:hypothetical protein
MTVQPSPRFTRPTKKQIRLIVRTQTVKAARTSVKCTSGSGQESRYPDRRPNNWALFIFRDVEVERNVGPE